MKQIFLFCSLLLAAAALPYYVPAVRCQWMPCRGYSGAQITCFARNGSNLFAGAAGTTLMDTSSNGGLFISTDDGASWRSAGLTNITVRTLATSDGDLFAGTDSGLYLSTDNGSHWTSISNGLPDKNITSLVRIGNYIFASFGGFMATDGAGVYRSSNKGASWSAVNEGLADTNVKCLLAHGTLLYAGTDHGGFYVDNGGSLFVSSDSGVTWSNTWLINTTVWCLASRGGDLFVGTGSGVHLTTDTALSWIYPTTNFAATSLAIYNSEIFAGTYGHGVYLSTDDGQTWSGKDWNPVNTGFAENRSVVTIECLMIDSYSTVPILFTGTWGGLWRRPISEFESSPAPPVQGTWTIASAGDSAGIYNGISCVVDGKIYMLGGLKYGGMFQEYNSAVEVFDPLSDSWSTPVLSGTFTQRMYPCASVINGKIYVFSGLAGPLHSAAQWETLTALEVFDPSTNSWTVPVTTGTCTPRYGAITATIDSKLYVIGGRNLNDSSMVNRVEVFDPRTNEWSTPSTVGSFRGRMGAASAVIDGKIYVVGGYTFDKTEENITALQVFDPQTNIWSTPETSGRSTPRDLSTACVLDGKIYWIGGAKVGADHPSIMEVYDPTTNTWSTPSTGGEFTGRSGLTSAVVNGKIYVIGGFTGINLMNTNEVYTPMRSEVQVHESVANISVYPNPTSGLAKIEHLGLGAHHITVANMLGETVIKMEKLNTTSFSIDLSSLPSGTYFVRVSDAKTITSGLIVRE